MFTSNGLGEMGWGLPSAIGAALSQLDRDLICFMSDGSMMMNLQELQTIINYNLPIKIVIFNNDGYLFIKHTQKMLFKGNYVGVDDKTGIGLPKYEKIANAFGFKYYRCMKIIPNLDKTHTDLMMKSFLNHKGPAICEVFMDPEQPLTPKVKGVLTEDGILAPPIEEMSPLLDLDTIEDNMLIDVNDISYSIDREKE